MGTYSTIQLNHNNGAHVMKLISSNDVPGVEPKQIHNVRGKEALREKIQVSAMYVISFMSFNYSVIHRFMLVVRMLRFESCFVPVVVEAMCYLHAAQF